MLNACADYCTSTSLVLGRSALRSAAHGDTVVPSHRTDWGLRSFAVAGPSSWNALPVDLKSSSFGLNTFASSPKGKLIAKTGCERRMIKDGIEEFANHQLSSTRDRMVVTDIYD